MNKTELLKEIQGLASTNSLTQQELLDAYARGTSQGEVQGADPVFHKRLSIGDVLSYLGGAIVVIGIAVLIGGSWELLNLFARILVTLGSGIAAYIIGALFIQRQKLEGVAQAFFLISALVIPVGLYVVFDAAGVAIYGGGMEILISLILLLTFSASFWVYRRTIFLIFSILFATWLFFAATRLLASSSDVLGGDIMLYTLLSTGLSYMLIGHYFTVARFHTALVGWLYGIGSLVFLGAALALGGWSPQANLFWEIIYPALTFGIIFLSTVTKSRAFLIWGSVFLMGYILKITGEYFSQGLGWPLALVIAGLLLIGVGYYVVFLNKEYLTA